MNRILIVMCALAFAVAANMIPATVAQADSNPVPNCISFDSVPSGVYIPFSARTSPPMQHPSYPGLPVVGHSFSTSIGSVTMEEFEWGNGQAYNGGAAVIVSSGLAGGTLNEIEVNNINLQMQFPQAVNGLGLRFGEYGGNINFMLNGDFRNIANFATLNNQIVGGVHVSVVNGFGNDMGTIALSGAIHNFMIGGQELWLDNICS